MSSWLDTNVDVEIAPSYRELAIEIEGGRVHLAWTPPAVCARVRGGIGRLLTAVRYGATECEAALVVQRDSGLKTLQDLRGKRATWVDPFSTSGHLLAVAHLTENGYRPELFLSEQRFAGSYAGALVDVAEGRADVTSVFVVAGDEAATLREMHDIMGRGADQLALLCRTASAPFDALVIGERASASEWLEHKILSLHQRMSPPALLLEMCRADRFVVAEQEQYKHLERFVEPHMG